KSSTLHDRGISGNSGASLHAKTFSIDGKTVFIGSFNFDPRSTLLNTEMGFVIESETLAQLIDKRFIQSQYDAAWQLRLDRWGRSEEHTSELQSRFDLVCRLLLENKKHTPTREQSGI